MPTTTPNPTGCQTRAGAAINPGTAVEAGSQDPNIKELKEHRYLDQDLYGGERTAQEQTKISFVVGNNDAGPLLKSTPSYRSALVAPHIDYRYLDRRQLAGDPSRLSDHNSDNGDKDKDQEPIQDVPLLSSGNMGRLLRNLLRANLAVKAAPTTAVPKPRSMKVNTLSKFSGNKRSEFPTFVSANNLYFRSQKSSYPNCNIDKVTFAGLYPEGTTRKWFGLHLERSEPEPFLSN